jgi:hypothetical protein
MREKCLIKNYFNNGGFSTVRLSALDKLWAKNFWSSEMTV